MSILDLDAASIKALPITGKGAWGQDLAKAWQNVISNCSGTINTGLWPAQQDRSQFIVVANAIAYLRTGTQSYKDKVVNALAAVAGDSSKSSPTKGWLTGSTPDAILWGHHIQAFVHAADLIGYRTPDMLAFADKSRYRVIGAAGSANTMEKYAKRIVHSRGCHHRANYFAICAYLGESMPTWAVPLAKAFFGDNSAGYHTYSDSTASKDDGLSANGCDISGKGGTWGAVNSIDKWWPVNKSSNPKLDGALIPMVQRENSDVYVGYREWPDGSPKWGDSYIGTSSSPASAYFFTQFNGTMFWMLLLEKNGVPDIWTTVTNNGPLRAMQYIWKYRKNWHSGGPAPYAFPSYNSWIDCLMERKYPGKLDRSYGNPQTAPYACKSGQGGMGFTDWLVV